MNWETIAAVYGAGLATAVFIWQIIDKILDQRSRVSVCIIFRGHTPVYHDGLGPTQYVLVIKLVNKGNQSRYIEKPMLEFNVATPHGKFITPIDLRDKTIYPINFAPGQTIEPFYDLKSIRDDLIRYDLTGIKKVRAFASDTLGKTYTSDWMPLRDFLYR